jgi:endonuclease YncB( thermonuclease family)
MTLHPQNQQYHQIILVYQGQADYFRGIVTEIVDGDTLDINNVRVRLALVNTPGRVENGYTEAIDFVQSVCGLGTTALVDEDDGQKEGSFDRVIGLVYCGGDNINDKKSLNELLLERSNAVIYQDFCGIREFSSASWPKSWMLKAWTYSTRMVSYLDSSKLSLLVVSALLIYSF